ncbi:hypothetical protein CBL_04397 [Carabus blaptoides fortunei]
MKPIQQRRNGVISVALAKISDETYFHSPPSSTAVQWRTYVSVYCTVMEYTNVLIHVYDRWSDSGPVVTGRSSVPRSARRWGPRSATTITPQTMDVWDQLDGGTAELEEIGQLYDGGIE